MVQIMTLSLREASNVPGVTKLKDSGVGISQSDSKAYASITTTAHFENCVQIIILCITLGLISGVK